MEFALPDETASIANCYGILNQLSGVESRIVVVTPVIGGGIR